MSKLDQDELDTLEDQAPADNADTVEAEAPEVQDDSDGWPLVQEEQETADPEQVEDTQEDTGGDAEAQASLTTPTSEPEVKPEHNWEQRYKSLQGEFTKDRQQLKQLQQQLEEMQRAKYQQEQEEQSSLKPFMASHPRHQEFRQAKQAYRASLEAARYIRDDNDRKAFLTESISSLPQDMQQALVDERMYRENFMERLSSDPMEALGEFFDQRVENQWNQRLQQQEANARIQNFWGKVWEDKENVALAQSHPEGPEAFVAEALREAPNNPALYFKLKKLERSQSVVKESEQKAAHARAQQKARQGDAVVDRDANTASITDISAEVDRRAKQRGIPAHHPDIIDIVAEVEAELSS